MALAGQKKTEREAKDDCEALKEFLGRAQDHANRQVPCLKIQGV